MIGEVGLNGIFRISRRNEQKPVSAYLQLNMG